MTDHPDGLRPTGAGDHITTEEMPRLVEQGIRGDLPSDRRKHLAQCPDCLALFCELSRGRLDHELAALPHAAPADFVALGKTLPGLEPVAAEASAQSGGFTRRWRTWVPALAAVAACLVLFGPWNRQPGPLSADDVAVIRKALVADSRHGLVHLGIDGGDPASSTVYRSPSAPDQDALAHTLDRLQAAYDPADPSADLAYQRAAGHLALADLALARSLLDEAHLLFPGDWRFDFLAAHLAYRESDLPQARTLLAELAAQHPQQGAIRLNLGLVLRELNDTAGPEILAEIRDRYPGSLLAERAADHP